MRILAAVMGLLLACTGVAVGSERRAALVIGNGAYKSVPRLPNAQNDARAMATLLRAEQFEVEEHTDLDLEALRRAFRAFIGRTRDADLAVVYYAGHGIEVGGMNYLIPVDAKLQTDLDVQDEAFALDRVLQVLEPARKLRLVMLDACRDNPFLNTMKRTVASRSVARGLAQVEPSRPNTLIAFAAKAGSTADDGDGAHSPFTEALLKHITVPGLDVRLALGRVRDDVVEHTKSKQEPFVYGSLGGAVVTLSSTPAVEGRRDDSDEARRDFAVAVKLATVDALDAFVARYPQGYVSDMARKERDRLAARSPAPAPAVAAPAGGDGQRVVFEQTDRDKVREIAHRHKLPLPDYAFDKLPTVIPDSARRFIGVFASVVGFNGSSTQSMLIINAFGETGQLEGHYIVGPPPAGREGLPPRILPLRGNVSGDTLLFSTRGAAIESTLSARAELQSHVVQTNGREFQIRYKPVWRLVERHDFPPLAAVQPVAAPPKNAARSAPRASRVSAPVLDVQGDPPRMGGGQRGGRGGGGGGGGVVNSPRFPACSQMASQRGLSAPSPARRSFVRNCVLSG